MPITASFGTNRHGNGEDDLTLYPNRARRNPGSVPGIVVCHPFNGSAKNVGKSALQMQLLRALARHFVVTFPDLGFNTWGNSTGITRVMQARNHLINQFECNPKIGLVAMSMGNTNAMSYARAYPHNVRFLASIQGAIDLKSLWDIEPTAVRPSLNLAYPPVYSDTTHGPTANPAIFAPHIDRSIPIRLWTGSVDSLILPSTVAAFRAKRPETTEHSLVGYDHGEPAIGAAIPSLMTWVKRYALD